MLKSNLTVKTKCTKTYCAGCAAQWLTELQASAWLDDNRRPNKVTSCFLLHHRSKFNIGRNKHISTDLPECISEGKKTTKKLMYANIHLFLAGRTVFIILCTLETNKQLSYATQAHTSNQWSFFMHIWQPLPYQKNYHLGQLQKQISTTHIYFTC